jgi:hypothetical protein
MTHWLRPDPQSERLYRGDKARRRDEQQRIEDEWTAAQERLAEAADRLMDEEKDREAERDSERKANRSL